jgi:hypothetical protein
MAVKPNAQKKAPDLTAGALSRSEERAAQNTKE